MSEIIKIDPKEYGLEEQKATELTSGLKTILSEREVLKNEYLKIISLEITETNLKVFRELRLKIRDNRTKGIEKWHKANKEFFLTGGRFVDAIKNKEVIENEAMEEKLELAEKHFENLEKERIEKLRIERLVLLEPYDLENISVIDLGKMETSLFETFFEGVKVNHEKKLVEAKKAEEERLIAIELEKQKQFELENENKRLKEEAEQKEKELAAERLKQEELLKAERLKANAIKLQKDSIFEFRKLAMLAHGFEYSTTAMMFIHKHTTVSHSIIYNPDTEKEWTELFESIKGILISKEKEAEQAKIIESQKAESEKQRLENEKIHAELKAKQDAELAKIKEEQKTKDKLAKASDKDKFKALGKSIVAIEYPEVTSDAAKEILANFKSKNEENLNYLRTAINNLN